MTELLAHHEDLLHRTNGAIDLLTETIERLASQWDAERQSNASPRAYITALEVKGARTRLFGLTGYNQGPGQFLHIFDRANPPANGQAPEIVVPIAAASGFSLDFGLRGRHFTNGLIICASTTDSTLTLSTTPNVWLDVQYD